MKSILPYSYAELIGSHYMMGYQHGLLLKEEIQVSLSTYQELFYTEKSYTWSQVKKKALSYLTFIQKAAPHLLEEMEGNSLIHANHLIGSKASTIHDEGPDLWPDSCYRYGRAQTILEGSSSMAIERIKEVLQDHIGYPHSICGHQGEGKTGIKELETICSLIIQLEERQILLTGGPPCCNDYQTIFL